MPSQTETQSTVGKDPAREDLVDFPRLFQRQVDETPSAMAVQLEDQSLTYAELNGQANRIAHYLLDQGVNAERCVGLCLDRSPDAIAAMLGIFKAGCAFVPLDPESPPERLAYMVDDAAIDHLFCDARYRQLLDNHDRDSLMLIDLHDDVFDAQFAAANPCHSISTDQLAYIMYTSGSTGRPKGVQIEHEALAAYCFADIDIYQLQPTDRTLQFSTLNFDIAIEEIFPPLLTGGCVVIRPRQRAAKQNELSAIVEQYDVTAIHLATAYWHEWVDLMRAAGDRVPHGIRLMVVTGEKVSAQHFRRWRSLCDHTVLWCNAYGPTEATVSATVFVPADDWDGDNMPIGKPLQRYEALIVDAEGHPVSAGETGELLIGGPAVARGYLNRPEFTAHSFVTLSIDGAAPKRYYRSGDLARWLPDGEIEFGGRSDHQIKLGSYRIEPGEIEAASHRHPQVLESLVSYDQIQDKKYLVAYVARGDHKLTANEVASHLRACLPTYMVPTRFVFCHSFPKTLNGKIDRKALPSPDTAQIARDGEYQAAETKLEQRLARIWSDVLNVAKIGRHDDFFALGGSSLLVTRVITQIQSQMGIEIPVRDFFANPTIASAARQIQEITAPGSTLKDASVPCRLLRSNLPDVDPFFFENDGEQLFAVHYRPLPKFSGDAGPPESKLPPAVLICPPYGHEYQMILWDPVADGEQFCQLLSDFHDRALTSYSRFAIKRQRSNIQQLYGFAMSDATRASFAEVVLDSKTLLDSDNRLVVTSQGYVEAEAGLQPIVEGFQTHGFQAHGCQVHKTADQIDWHHNQYAESAFSSPETYQAVRSVRALFRRRRQLPHGADRQPRVWGAVDGQLWVSDQSVLHSPVRRLLSEKTSKCRQVAGLPFKTESRLGRFVNASLRQRHSRVPWSRPGRRRPSTADRSRCLTAIPLHGWR